MKMTKSDAITFMLTNTSLTVYLDGEPKTIFKNDSVFDDALEALKIKDWDRVAKLFDVSIEGRSEGKVRRGKDGLEALVDGEFKKIPSDIEAEIQKLIQNDLPLDTLINFAIKVLQNPNPNAVKQLFSFVKSKNVCLSGSGGLLLNKVVDKNYKDLRTGKIDNSVGTEVILTDSVAEKETVGCQPSSPYINYSGNIVILTEVSPADVLSVYDIYGYPCLKVSRYLVLDTVDSDYKEPLRSPGSKNQNGFFDQVDNWQIFEEEYVTVD